MALLKKYTLWEFLIAELQFSHILSFCLYSCFLKLHKNKEHIFFWICKEIPLLHFCHFFKYRVVSCGSWRVFNVLKTHHSNFYFHLNTHQNASVSHWFSTKTLTIALNINNPHMFWTNMSSRCSSDCMCQPLISACWSNN